MGSLFEEAENLAISNGLNFSAFISLFGEQLLFVLEYQNHQASLKVSRAFWAVLKCSKF